MNSTSCSTDKSKPEPLLSPERCRQWFCAGYLYAIFSGARLVTSDDPEWPLPGR
jgi:hypothetical protein